MVLLGVAPRARHGGTSSGPAGYPSDLGAEGHGFFPQRILPAMRRGHGQSGPKPCSAPVLATVCIVMMPVQPGSIVTVLIGLGVGMGVV